MSTHQAERSTRTDRFGHGIRRYSALIVLFWLALAVVTNVFVPQLEKVAEAHNVSLSPQDAPSLQASKEIGKKFQQYDSDSAAMIVLEGQQPPRRRRTPLLRRPGEEADPGHHPRRARTGLLGG